MCVCVRVHVCLSKINELIVFKFEYKFCFVLCFQNVTAKKIRIVKSRPGLFGTLCV